MQQYFLWHFSCPQVTDAQGDISSAAIGGTHVEQQAQHVSLNAGDAGNLPPQVASHVHQSTDLQQGSGVQQQQQQEELQQHDPATLERQQQAQAILQQQAEPHADVQGQQAVAPVGAYTQREEHLQRQEASGEIEFAYVLNDGQPSNMIR